MLDPTDERITAHLTAWLGAWPPRRKVDVIGSVARTRPGWDGRIRPLLGVATPAGTVLSVAPEHAEAVRQVLHDAEDDEQLAAAARFVTGDDAAHVGRGVFRWSVEVPSPDELADVGDWVDPHDPRIPDWLRPFNYPAVLIAWDDDGRYGAGVGIKVHDPVGREIAVVTEEPLRGRAMARRLVAQAARRILAEGCVPTYLHALDNVGSARVADAVGFPDLGWRILGLADRG